MRSASTAPSSRGPSTRPPRSPSTASTADMPAFGGLVIVVAVAFAAPLVLGLFPGVKLPAVVLEIVAGIVVGPSVLGLVEDDQAVAVVAVIGLTFVLFLAGLELGFSRVRGR